MYIIEVSSRAERQFRKLARDVQASLSPAIDSPAATPRPHGARKLKGSSEHRLRVGDYRIVDRIDDRRLTVLAVQVGHRREIYRDL